MAGPVSFTLDSREVNRELAAIGRKARRVIPRALNRTANTLRTREKRGIAKETGIKIGVINKQMSIKKATPGNPRAIINVNRQAIPLIRLGARGKEPSRGKGGGVTYRLGGRKHRLSNAFISTMPTGHRGVFSRKRKARLPIRERFGPSIASIFKKRLPAARPFALAELAKNVRAGLKFAQGGS